MFSDIEDTSSYAVNKLLSYFLLPGQSVIKSGTRHACVSSSSSAASNISAYVLLSQNMQQSLQRKIPMNIHFDILCQTDCLHSSRCPPYYHTTLNHYIDIFLIHPLPFSLLHRIQQIPVLPLVHHRADSQAKGLCRSGTHSLVPPATATDALASCDADLSTHIPDDHPICHVCQLSAHVSSLVGRPSRPPNDEHCLAILSSGQCSLLHLRIPSQSPFAQATDPGEARIEREL